MTPGEPLDLDRERRIRAALRALDDIAARAPDLASPTAAERLAAAEPDLAAAVDDATNHGTSAAWAGNEPCCTGVVDGEVGAESAPHARARVRHGVARRVEDGNIVGLTPVSRGKR